MRTVPILIILYNPYFLNFHSHIIHICITTYTKYTQLLFNIITKTDLFYQANKDITYLLKTKICLKQINFL